MARRKKRSNYGDHIELRGDDIYGVWLEPQTDGTYKKRRKKCANKIEARQWADAQKHKQKNRSSHAAFANGSFSALAEWFKHSHLIEPIYENDIRIDGVKDWKKQRAKLDRIAAYFGSRDTESITTADLQEYVRHRRQTDKVTAATINRDLSLIRSMFIKANILPRPVFPINIAAEAERDRVLSFEEEAVLLSHCTASERVSFKIRGHAKEADIDAKREHLRLPIIMAVDTAMRKGEMKKLRWSDIDLDKLTITVRAANSKTSKTRIVGITPRLKADLEKEKRKTGLVFTGDWARAFKTACRRANLTNLRWHDLRHTAITRMVRAGIPHTEAMKITDHTQMKTFLRYLNVQSEAVANAAKMLSDLVDRNS